MSVIFVSGSSIPQVIHDPTASSATGNQVEEHESDSSERVGGDKAEDLLSLSPLQQTLEGSSRPGQGFTLQQDKNLTNYIQHVYKDPT